MPNVQSEFSKLNEIISNNKEKEPLSLLGKKRKLSNDFEGIKEEDKDNKINNNPNKLNIQNIKEKEKEKNICKKKIKLIFRKRGIFSQNNTK